MVPLRAVESDNIGVEVRDFAPKAGGSILDRPRRERDRRPTRFDDVGDRPAAAGADDGVIEVVKLVVSLGVSVLGDWMEVIDERALVVKVIWFIGALDGLKMSSASPSSPLFRFADPF